MNQNSNDPTNIFNTGGLDLFGPIIRQEHKLGDLNGTKVPIREIHEERVQPDGARQIFFSQEYLCQGCGATYITLGVNGAIKNNTVLCQSCIRSDLFLRLLKPIWSIFIRVDGH